MHKTQQCVELYIPIGLALDLYKMRPCIVPDSGTVWAGLFKPFQFSFDEAKAILFLHLLPDALKVLISAAYYSWCLWCRNTTALQTQPTTYFNSP